MNDVRDLAACLLASSSCAACAGDKARELSVAVFTCISNFHRGHHLRRHQPRIKLVELGAADALEHRNDVLLDQRADFVRSARRTTWAWTSQVWRRGSCVTGHQRALGSCDSRAYQALTNA